MVLTWIMGLCAMHCAKASAMTVRALNTGC